MLQRIARELSYFMASVYYNLKSFFTYRAQAWAWIFESMLSLLMNLIAVTVIYTVSSGIPGWSYYQLLFLTYVMFLTYGLVGFISNPWQVPQNLRSGRYDSFLTRPLNVLTIAFGTACVIPPLIGSVIGSIVVLAFLIPYLHFSLLAAASSALLYILGVAALVLFLQALAVASYKFLKSGFFINQAINTMSTLTDYPLTVYGGVAQLFFTLLLPIGIAGYYPVKVIIGGISSALYVFLVALSLVFIVVFYKLYVRLMRSYESGGG